MTTRKVTVTQRTVIERDEKVIEALQASDATLTMLLGKFTREGVSGTYLTRTRETLQMVREALKEVTP